MRYATRGLLADWYLQPITLLTTAAPRPGFIVGFGPGPCTRVTDLRSPYQASIVGSHSTSPGQVTRPASSATSSTMNGATAT